MSDGAQLDGVGEGEVEGDSEDEMWDSAEDEVEGNPDEVEQSDDQGQVRTL